MTVLGFFLAPLIWAGLLHAGGWSKGWCITLSILGVLFLPLAPIFPFPLGALFLLVFLVAVVRVCMMN